MRLRHHRWIGLGLIGLLVFSFCGGDGEEAGGRGARGRRGGRGGRPAAAVPVKVERVVREDISDYILANTTLEAERWVDVRSRTSGQVVEILREEGDRVVRGAVLMKLDAEAARLQASQMEVAFQDALRNFQRYERIYQRKLGSQERYEEVKAQLDRSKAQLEQAQLNLSYTTISSPVTGTVTIRSVEVGNMVTNNQVVFSVADFDPLLARIRIPEKNIGKIKVGQGARITVESAPGRTFAGRVKMISPVVNPESGTIKVTIEIPGKQAGILRPGMFASVYIITETHAKALVVPKKALVLEGEGNQIFVYEKDEESGMGKAARRKLKTGFTDNERLEVVEGLSEGERVITVGQEGLRPGTSVRLVGEGVPASAQASGGQAAQMRAGSPSRGSPGGAGGASEEQMSPDQIKQMQERIFGRFPAVKAEFDKRVKADPKLATDGEKWRAFLTEMREKGVLPARRGRPR
ncbi:MAG: efflux RND transporter periplasmic adaptor subunit [Candidatus Latescibacteria bacterium]|jgi:membrane fusion protein (multidrug efflux system)|nr:efflux RND transporter periplasmic adaptor subunit [Candidatus Latescibacterota bacterium]